MAAADWTEIINTILSSLCQSNTVTQQQMQIGIDFARKMIPDTQSNYMTMAKDILSHNFDSHPVYKIVFAQKWMGGTLVNVLCPEIICQLAQKISEDLDKAPKPYLPSIISSIQQLYDCGSVVELRENYDSVHYRLSCSLEIDGVVVSCLWILRLNSQGDNSISMSLPMPGAPNIELNLETE